MYLDSAIFRHLTTKTLMHLLGGELSYTLSDLINTLSDLLNDLLSSSSWLWCTLSWFLTLWCRLGGSRVLWELLRELNVSWRTWQVLAEWLWDVETALVLEVLEQAAQRSLSRAESRVQCVHVLLLDLGLELVTEADLQCAGLVVGAVRAGDELLVLTLVWEPSLKIVLLGGGVVERAGDDLNNTVWDAKGLVELLGVPDHLLEGLPGLLWVGEHELLNLLELVDTENSPRVASVRSSLSAVAGGESGVLDWELLWHDPLVGVESRYWLLRSGNEVLVVDSISVLDLVKLLVEILKLGGLGHVVLQHELWSLEGSVSSGVQELETVVDHGLVEEHTPVSQEVSTVTDNLNTALWVVTIQASEDLVVGKAVPLLNGDTLWTPLAQLDVLVLYVR